MGSVFCLSKCPVHGLCHCDVLMMMFSLRYLYGLLNNSSLGHRSEIIQLVIKHKDFVLLTETNLMEKEVGHTATNPEETNSKHCNSHTSCILGFWNESSLV